MARSITLNPRPADSEAAYPYQFSLLDAAGVPTLARTLDVTRFKRGETPGTVIATASVGAGNQIVTELGLGVYEIILERADVDTPGPLSLLIEDNAGGGGAFEDLYIHTDLIPAQDWEAR